MIGIIAALDQEIAVLIDGMDSPKRLILHNTIFYKGKLQGNLIVAVKSGIGKVNAAISTILLLTCFDISAVINIGCAGGLELGINNLDVVISDKTLQYDKNYENKDIVSTLDNCSPLINILGDISERTKSFSIHYGLIVSGDRFVDQNDAGWITASYPDAICCDMEADAIATACKRIGVPFVIVRGISDLPLKGNNKENFDANIVGASNNSVEVMSLMIDRINDLFI